MPDIEIVDQQGNVLGTMPVKLGMITMHGKVSSISNSGQSFWVGRERGKYRCGVNVGGTLADGGGGLTCISPTEAKRWGWKQGANHGQLAGA